MNVAFLPAAEEELNEAVAYYEERVPGLGEDLLAEADARPTSRRSRWVKTSDAGNMLRFASYGRHPQEAR